MLYSPKSLLLRFIYILNFLLRFWIKSWISLTGVDSIASTGFSAWSFFIVIERFSIYSLPILLAFHCKVSVWNLQWKIGFKFYRWRDKDIFVSGETAQIRRDATINTFYLLPLSNKFLTHLITLADFNVIWIFESSHSTSTSGDERHASRRLKRMFLHFLTIPCLLKRPIN